MADSTETRALLLQINATTEKLRSELSAAERATASFASATQRHLDAVDGRFEVFGKSLEALEGPMERLKQLGEFAVGALIGESLLEAGKHALEFAGNVQFVSEQVGTSTKFLQEYRYAAGQFGIATGAADEGLGKFARSVGEAANGNKGMIDLFNRLGVNVLDAAGKVRTVEGVFLDTSDAIARVESPAQRAADVMTLFGRQAIPLVPLLAQGAAGFSGLADAANQLGVVLSPDLIKHSEEVNHKLAALKQIVDAEMANTIAQNAGAIEGLATSMVHMAGAIAKFLNSNPREALTILGAMAGSRFGIVGAAAGAIGGFFAGSEIAKSNDDKNDDLKFRRQRLLEAKAAFDDANARPASGYTTVRQSEMAAAGEGPNSIQATRAEYVRQISFMQRALADAHQAHSNADELGSDAPGTHNPVPKADADKAKRAAEAAARKAKEADQKAADQRLSYEGQSKQLDDQDLATRAQLTSDVAEQFALKREQLDDDRRDHLAQLDAQVKAGKLEAQDGERLKTKTLQLDADRADLLNRQQDIEEARAADDLARHRVEIQRDQLGIEAALATTTAQRKAIALELLAADEDYQRKHLQAIIDDPGHHSPEEIEQAKADLTALDVSHPGRVAQINQDNQNPLQAYGSQLHKNTDDMNEALQGVAANGLKSMEDGLTGIITGTESVKQAFTQMAASIISDLARIAIEKLIVSYIPGFSGGGELDHFAGGGMIRGPGTGTSDSILAFSGRGRALKVSNGEFIVNAAATRDHLALLHAINDNSLPRFADGGSIGLPVIRTPRISRAALQAVARAPAPQREYVYVAVDKSPLFDTHVSRIAAPMAQAAAVAGSQDAQQAWADHQYDSIP